MPICLRLLAGLALADDDLGRLVAAAEADERSGSPATYPLERRQPGPLQRGDIAPADHERLDDAAPGQPAKDRQGQGRRQDVRDRRACGGTVDPEPGDEHEVEGDVRAETAQEN